MEFRNSNFRELKFSGDDAGTFSGYASVFGPPADSYGDVIERGAYRATIEEAKRTGNWPLMLSQHGGFGGDDAVPVGLWTSMAEDAKGLRVEGRLADTERGRELHTLLKMQPRPALSGLSIGFKADAYRTGTKAGEPRRTLTAITLFEISLVSRPAADRARVTSVKADEKFKPNCLERLLRDAGYSRREAMSIIAHGLKSAAGLRDADAEAAAEELARRMAALTRKLSQGI